MKMKFNLGDTVKVVGFKVEPKPIDDDDELNAYIGLQATVVDLIVGEYSYTPIGVEFTNDDFLWFNEDELELV
jgi:hypothetical protein